MDGGRQSGANETDDHRFEPIRRAFVRQEDGDGSNKHCVGEPRESDDGGRSSEAEPNSRNEGAPKHESNPKLVDGQKCVQCSFGDGIKRVICRGRAEHRRSASGERQAAELVAVELVPQRSTARDSLVQKYHKANQMRPNVARLIVYFYQAQSAVASAVVYSVKISYGRIRFVPFWQLGNIAELLRPALTRNLQLLRLLLMLLLLPPEVGTTTLLRVQWQQRHTR